MLVQTTAPDAPSIEAAARHDSEGFLAGELERRRALRYPPFADLVRVVVSAEAAEPVRAAAARVAEAIGAGVSERTEILGPAPLFRLRGRERRQVVVKTTERASGRPVGGRGRRGGRPRPRAARRGVLGRRRPAVTRG